MTQSDIGIVEQIRDLQKRATPGPWKIGLMGGEKQRHVVDMGGPPTAPFVALNEGYPASAGFTGFSHSAVVHSDGDRCEIEANAELIALVPDMAAIITEMVEALEDITEYAECQIAAFSSGRAYLDLTGFPHLIKRNRATLAKVRSK